MILSSNGQNIFPEEVEAVVNSMPYVKESLVVSRGSALVALVYAGGDEFMPGAEELQEYLQSSLAKINSQLPSYSRLSRIEIVPTAFEKTPKQSIKRFLYS